MSDSDRTGTAVHSERHAAVLVLTLDGKATRNSLGPDVYERVPAEIIAAGINPTLGAIVLTGANGFFCSGGNIQNLRESARQTLAEATSGTNKLNALIKCIVESPKPVIAAVEGGATGAGFSLALACDMIVAADVANFAVAHVRVGLSPDGGATHFLRSALPRQIVAEMCMLGQPMPAARLAQAGVINALAPAGDVLREAMELANRLCAGPPQAIGRIKYLIAAAARNDLATHLDAEARGLNLARFSPEAAEGLSAFLEKRRPDFVAAAKKP